MLNLRYYLFHYGVPLVSLVKDTYNFVIKVYAHYYDNNELVFFHNNPSAYLSSYIDVHNSNSGVVVWKFNRYTSTFYQAVSDDKTTKRLPILSATLVCNETKINLDDFIDSLKIETANYSYPSLAQVVEVWAYSSRTVLDRSKDWKITYLDTNVNEFTKSIFTDDWNSTLKPTDSDKN